MALSNSQRVTLQVLYNNRPNKMNYQEISKQATGVRPIDISNALKSLANKDYVYQLDGQGKTTITGDGISALMS